jgi:tetratricopeptide (TPR) repeat protein
MRTGRIDAALGSLDDALRRQPHEAGLHLVRSIALEYADRISEALASAQAGLAQAPHDTQLLRQSAHLCAEAGQGERALGFAQSAASLAPADPAVQVTLCEALLAAGRIAEGEAVAARLHDMQPLDQHAIALRATAWRLLGDARYAALHDYEHLVHAAPLELPEGLLAELAPELESQHRFSTHPFQQSVRGGSQLPLNAPEMARPALRALFDSLQLAVHAHLARLGTGPDPFRSRNTGRARVTGAWSVRLASGGYHTDHVHPRGWLSSAFYVTVPDDMSGRERAGWLRLGRPGIATTPPLGADFFVEPKPGTLVLFPAYMWLGVEPFQSARLRMSVAFDALPA